MYTLNDAVIIGITGRSGKSSTAYLVHKYLQSIGKKSIIYSSCLVESPASFAEDGLSREFGFETEKDIVNILKEAIAYEAEYIILECWEASIAKGVFDNIPFDIKCLTKFYYTGNGHISAEQVYQNKLRFFKDDEDAICLFNIVGDEKFTPESSTARMIAEANCSNVVLYDSIGPTDWFMADSSLAPYNVIFRCRGQIANNYTFNDVKYHSDGRTFGLEYQSANLYCDGQNFNINTTLAGSAHLENVVSAMAILNEAGALDINAFQSFISDPDLQIPGRMEDIEYQDKTIIIDTDADNALPIIKRLAGNRRIIAVDSYRLTRIKSNEQYRKDNPNISYEYNFNYEPSILNQYADFVYVTVDDLCDLSDNNIVNNFSSRLTVPYEIIKDRKEAIRTAIINNGDNHNDIICILGRGNRDIRFIGYNSIEMFNDRKVVQEILEDLDNKNK